ncbi:MAG: YesL family protein [Lachnospiraceae bacterium]|nr:YesL family protein [Lachnospiraceae bacterium]
MMFLSILWIVCCIPFITIGPATSALYYVMVKVIRRGRGYVFREFVHSFKENFKVGAISTIILLIAAAVLVIDYQFAKQMIEQSSTLGNVLYAVYFAVIIIVCLMTVFIFPILSRFTLKVKDLFKTTFFMSIRHLPTSILLILIVVVSAVAIWLTVIGAILIPAVCAWICSFLIERIFKKYMPKPEESDEESGKDTWYLE